MLHEMRQARADWSPSRAHAAARSGKSIHHWTADQLRAIEVSAAIMAAVLIALEAVLGL